MHLYWLYVVPLNCLIVFIPCSVKTLYCCYQACFGCVRMWEKNVKVTNTGACTLKMKMRANGKIPLMLINHFSSTEAVGVLFCFSMYKNLPFYQKKKTSPSLQGIDKIRSRLLLQFFLISTKPISPLLKKVKEKNSENLIKKV